ncbi:Glutaredoxin-C9 [Turnera subulata]|uniref:Glutaredoxin-C9 n=1 Tax=Turnera subulata TaxID=218843 RepID=A0A9Q0JKL4_9ROSI|nr:Glutaredoxin-C9 [Turnera subulata]
MQQAIPYKSWLPLYTNHKTLNPSSAPLITTSSYNNVVATQELLKGTRNNMGQLVSENAIIVFARRGCCMSHVVKRLLLGLGVNPAIYEIDEGDESGVLQELEMIMNSKGDGNDHKNVQFPAVFIGGRLFGGLDRVMATHITGELVPILKEAGALWL